MLVRNSREDCDIVRMPAEKMIDDILKAKADCNDIGDIEAKSSLGLILHLL